MIKSKFIKPTSWEEYGETLNTILEQIQNEENSIIIEFIQDKNTMPEHGDMIRLFYSATILYEVKSQDQSWKYSGMYAYEDLK